MVGPGVTSRCSAAMEARNRLLNMAGSRAAATVAAKERRASRRRVLSLAGAMVGKERGRARLGHVVGGACVWT